MRSRELIIINRNRFERVSSRELIMTTKLNRFERVRSRELPSMFEGVRSRELPSMFERVRSRELPTVLITMKYELCIVHLWLFPMIRVYEYLPVPLLNNDINALYTLAMPTGKREKQYQQLCRYTSPVFWIRIRTDPH